MGKFIDLTGMIFGRLRVIVFDGVNIHNQSKWLCECIEGNKVIVTSGDLKSRNTQSCGCLQKEMANKAHLDDLTGRIYGSLIVIKRDSDHIKKSGIHAVQWLCQCKEDGNLIVVRAKNLKNGHSISCGCLRESFISSELKKYLIKKYSAIKEYKIFRNPKTNYYLPYDIYISKYNMFIEVHGIQHYKFKKHFHRTEEGFKYSQYKDKIKKEYAEQNGIYIEIDLRIFQTIKNVIIHIENIISENNYER